jgi:uncharacterized membrane protein YdfJ with MMPL/SSD domain
MKKQIIWYVVGVLIAAALTWLVVAPTETEKKKEAPTKEVKKGRKKPLAEAKAEKAKKRLVKKEGAKSDAKKKRKIIVESDEEFTPEEQQLADRIQAAMDDDNFKALQKELEAAASSTNVAIRQAAVDALAWFDGAQALPDLTLFMADENEDVRNAACDAWETGVTEIEDVNLRGEAVIAGMNVVYDRDHLDSMVMEINDMSNQRQLEILTQIIEGKNKLAAEAAKEHYEFVTGEEYQGVEAAQKWLDENPDESDDE